MTRRLFLAVAAATTGAFFAGRRVLDFFKGSTSELSSKGTASDPIVSAAIYPGIGVARMGNSTLDGEDFFDGPEVDTQLYLDNVRLRDKKGALKRQAQRFRIYGRTASGKTVELTSDNTTSLEWSVHLANKKASWYRFDVAMDTQEAKDAGLVMPLRNKSVLDRNSLVIDPGARTISGRNEYGSAYRFNNKKFMGIAVNLGELRTDEKGRLRVLGGLGKAGTPDPKKYPVFTESDAQTFNNADGWYDDTSDGPVHAKVTIGDKEIPVDGAWVFIAPPNYAPDVIGFRTLYDLMINLYLTERPDWIPAEAAAHQGTSFTKHILPLFRRLSNLQWVNRRFSDYFSAFGRFDFEDVEVIKKLGSKSERDERSRAEIFEYFRVPGMDRERSRDHKLWPMQYGDTYGSYEDSDKVNFFVDPVQLRHLKNWKSGNFIEDYDPNFKSPKKLSDVPVEEQPDMLTKAALDFCLADAFHPGCEVTWPMRHISAYRAAFRINERTDRDPREKDYGVELAARDIRDGADPLQKQSAGDLTKWMAIPWHGDTAFCRSGYEPEIDPYIPTFWPAAVPNQVLTEEDYKLVIDTTLPMEQRKEAFLRRAHWLRMFTGSAPQQMEQMIRMFGEVGTVESRPGPSDGGFPPVMLVETLSPKMHLAAASKPKSVARDFEKLGGTPRPLDKSIQEAGWESAEQLQQFRNIRLRRAGHK